MIYPEDLLAVVLWLSVALVCIDLGLVFSVLIRRGLRRVYFRRKDRARERFAPVVKDLLAHSSQSNQAIERFGKVRSGAERDALRDLLTTELATERRDRASELLLALGFVEEWARQAFGRRRARQLIAQHWHGASIEPPREWRWRLRIIFNLRLLAVPRAQAVKWLGQLTPEIAEYFIEEAKYDPSPEVRRVNISGMQQSRAALSYLLPELESALQESNGIAVRTIKAAIVRAEIEDPTALQTFLQHGDERLRFLVVDAIREICGKPRQEPLQAKDFPAEMRRLFLEKLVKDGSVDVRARSAEVIRHFHDAGATAALRELLRDDNEYVRLHAVRACADAYYSELIPVITERMTDACWRVREAAVQTCMHLGTRGMRALADLFLTTTDRYACEQIAEELQRSGAIVEIIEDLEAGAEPSRMATELCKKMVSMGKSSLLAELLAKHHSHTKRARLLKLLAAARTAYTEAVLAWIASQPDDPLAKTAQGMLQENAFAAEAGGRS